MEIFLFSIFFDKILAQDFCHFSKKAKIDFCWIFVGVGKKFCRGGKKVIFSGDIFDPVLRKSDFCRNRFLSISVFYFSADKNPADKNWSAQILYFGNEKDVKCHNLIVRFTTSLYVQTIKLNSMKIFQIKYARLSLS